MADYIIGGVLLLAIVVSVIASIVRVVKKAKIRAEEKTREVDDVIIKHGVRYTPEATIVDKDGVENVTYVKGDIIIKPRKVVKVGKGEEIKPGKWTILASNDSATVFNVRIGNFVQEYKHGQEIVLSEGDEICPTSTTIILR
ncbi:MAG: hypothetical protein E7341_03800 [Clostridiales bacterium]|nr:hypothetical protein [Clostridiales bacterium]